MFRCLRAVDGGDVGCLSAGWILHLRIPFSSVESILSVMNVRCHPGMVQRESELRPARALDCKPAK
jgi:hypothetical protein